MSMETAKSDDSIIDAAAVAELLDVSVRTVRRWTSERLIPFTRLPGRPVRFERGRVLKWFRDGCRKPQRTHLYRKKR